MKELIEIQSKLVAPKNQKNQFGGFNYRNLEGILEAVKPLLNEYSCTITFTDDLVMFGDRIFCKSTATLKNEAGEIETSTSFAELDAHKGMSKEQASGSSSSYARKYAACSLLAIDDNQDVDSMDNRPEEQRQRTEQQDNLTKLKLFCGAMKGRPDVNTGCLTKYYNFYSTRVQNWPAFDPQATWDKWVANERES